MCSDRERTDCVPLTDCNRNASLDVEESNELSNGIAQMIIDKVDPSVLETAALVAEKLT